ncbi:MAG: OmpA family protein [Saprospiraceae bacterium]|nr:OmpA family protein [Saprospiraceae bacterium]
MRQILLMFCLATFLLLAQNDIQAQPKHGFSYRYTLYNFQTPQADNSEWHDIWGNAQGTGAELAYQYRLFKNGYLVVPLKFGVTDISDGSGAGRYHFLGNLDALLQYQFFKYGNTINPYLHAGAGSTYDFDAGSDEFDMNVPLGLGFNIRILEGFYINPQTQYRLSFNEKNAWQHGVGFTAFFGGKKEPEMPKDTDKDGIPDVSDKCPTVPGVASAMGCPDRDGDGVADTDDKCVDVPGLASLMGCPDADGDGITDAEDDCPKDKGVAAFRGCPDTDNDGIPDKTDKCPREAGSAALNGCPDRDGDGIADNEDMCPTDKGPAALKGCPDRDGDGVIDRDDRCVDQPGPASNKGCPEMKKEDKEKVELAVKAVQFETGKAVLLPGSQKVLDDVAAVLLKYPEYKLSIGGHTDNTGNAAVNQKLSESRAKACYDYLVSKGVAANRLSHAGYGDTKPVGDNKTAAGRAANRRTEFDLMIK